MSLLIVILIILLCLALALYAIDKMPSDPKYKWIFIVAVVFVAIIFILQRSGLLHYNP